VNGFLLDTNVLSEFKRIQAPNPRVVTWLRATSPDALWTSVLNFGEIRKGIERLSPGRRRTDLELWLELDLARWFEYRLIPVSKAIADRWGIIAAQALAKGVSVPSVDCLIAATALEYDLTLVTRNVGDFAGLDVEILNPWEV
jgi:predicted nucleic acid-binding protein